MSVNGSVFLAREQQSCSYLQSLVKQMQTALHDLTLILSVKAVYVNTPPQPRHLTLVQVVLQIAERQNSIEASSFHRQPYRLFQ